MKNKVVNQTKVKQTKAQPFIVKQTKEVKQTKVQSSSSASTSSVSSPSVSSTPSLPSHYKSNDGEKTTILKKKVVEGKKAATLKNKDRSIYHLASNPAIGTSDFEQEEENIKFNFRVTMGEKEEGTLAHREAVYSALGKGIYKGEKDFNAETELEKLKEKGVIENYSKSNGKKGIAREVKIKRTKGFSSVFKRIINNVIQTDIIELLKGVQDSKMVGSINDKGLIPKGAKLPNNIEGIKYMKLLYLADKQNRSVLEEIGVRTRWILEIKEDIRDNGITNKLITRLVSFYVPITCPGTANKVYRELVQEHLKKTPKRDFYKVTIDEDLSRTELGKALELFYTEEGVEIEIIDREVIKEEVIGREIIKEEKGVERGTKGFKIGTKGKGKCKGKCKGDNIESKETEKQEKGINSEINQECKEEVKTFPLHSSNNSLISDSDISSPTTTTTTSSDPTLPLSKSYCLPSISSFSSLSSSTSIAPSLIPVSTPCPLSASAIICDSASLYDSHYRTHMVNRLLESTPVDFIDSRQIDFMTHNSPLPLDYFHIVTSPSPRLYATPDTLASCRKILRLNALSGLNTYDVDIQNCHALVACHLWKSHLPLLCGFLAQGNLWSFYEQYFTGLNLPFYKGLIKPMHHATLLGGGRNARQEHLKAYNLAHSSSPISNSEFKKIEKAFLKNPLYLELKKVVSWFESTYANKEVELFDGSTLKVIPRNEKLYRYWLVRDKRKAEQYEGNVLTVISCLLQSYEVAAMSYVIVNTQQYFVAALWQHDGMSIQPLYDDTFDVLQNSLKEFCDKFMAGTVMKFTVEEI